MLLRFQFEDRYEDRVDDFDLIAYEYQSEVAWDIGVRRIC